MAPTAADGGSGPRGPDALPRGPDALAWWSPRAASLGQWFERSRRLGFVPAFDDPIVEREFLDEYHVGGLESMRLAVVGALLIYLAFAAMALLGNHEPGNSFATRASAIAILAAFAYVLCCHRRRVLDHYVPIVAVLAVLSLHGVAYALQLTGIAAGTEAITPSSMIAIFILFSFARLPAWVTLAIGIGWTLHGLAVGTLITNLPDAEQRSMLYGVFAVFLGFVLLTSTERRERRLFLERRISQLAQRDLLDKTRQIDAASREKSRLLAAIGHDLRQPASAAALHLGMALDLLGRGRPAHCQSQIVQARLALKSLDESMADLLIGFRGDVVRRPMALDASGLNPLVADAVAVVDPEARELGIELRVVLSRRPLAVSTHAQALKRVIVNLLVNAVRHGRPADGRHGRVLVRVVTMQAAAEIHVIDRGPGLPSQRSDGPEPLAGDDDGVAPDRGRVDRNGLGLYLARRAIGSMPGHSIRVMSLPGHGTHFTVRLPLAPRPAPCAAACTGPDGTRGRRAGPDR